MKLTIISILTVLILLTGCKEQEPLNYDKVWYEFTPENSYEAPAKIGLEDWNEEPAGKYGRIESKADKLVYNSKEIKLWGLNNTYGACAPTNEMAEKRAAFYIKFGINSVRLHKYADGFGSGGIQTEDSFTEFDKDALNRMDYYIHTLKSNGIFTKLSPTFGVKIGPGDIVRVPFYKELGDFSQKSRIRATYGAVYLSEEIQDLQIEQTVKILNHVNAYTGMKYADDPAIFCVELFNEDAVLWHGGNWTLQRYPTLRKRTAKRFSEWLLDKYGSDENWRKQWGEEAIYTDTVSLANSEANLPLSIRSLQRRILDISSMMRSARLDELLE